MTEELLSQVVGKMNEACEGTVNFGTQRRPLGQGERGEPEWWVYRLGPQTKKHWTAASERYSPILTLCQLVDWCEAWLRGAEEMKAVFDKEKLS